MCGSAGQVCNAAQVKARSTCDLLRARWCEPVLSVVDIRVGDDEEAATDPFYRFGPTRFSVIPRSAVGNVSVRFVPDQVCPLLTHHSHRYHLLPSSGWSVPQVSHQLLISMFRVVVCPCWLLQSTAISEGRTDMRKWLGCCAVMGQEYLTSSASAGDQALG